MTASTAECSSTTDPTSSPSSRSITFGTAMNPNTPKLNPKLDIEQAYQTAQSPDQARLDRSPSRNENIETASPSTRASQSLSPKSSSSGAPSLGHIEPTWPKKIDVTKISALASWGRGQRLSGLLFDFHWVLSSNKAFFKLRASVQLKQAPGPRRDGRTNIFIHIYPERIQQLSFEAEPVDKILGNDTIALVFTLSRPPALVLPPTPLEPRNKASGTILASFFHLARQMSWTVYAAVPPRTLSAARIRQFCAAVSEPLAGSIVAFASAATLYQGQGGKIIEGDSLESRTAGDDDDIGCKVHDHPPKYEASGSAPVYLDPGKGKKRLRQGSSPEIDQEQKSQRPIDIEDLLQSRLSALERRFDDALAAHKKEIVELVGQAESRIMDTLRREMDEQSADFEESLDRKVKEEIAELEETVMQNISEAPLQATLTFPAHPWY
ncbi:uncharacterized protein EAF01_012056 [Botrytis porri]|uniref:Uncharacterized protein n=1 Tax=Botrytis porri TaxID=87229 RepID=A0A4Z1K8J9_9HELO|nr:uncharacterized protein EAF01_012056 [Botrytis porri]KAF7880161.1 hypothetical protein EAF01_012056 [Botrytis porri]TGO80410.1 hypothetical protein BPOR_1762g00010 [Botrytis porri]